jgi:hypothetical protein
VRLPVLRPTTGGAQGWHGAAIGRLAGARPTGGYGARFPTGFRSTGSRRRGRPIEPTSGKRQAVEAAGVDRAARVELGDVEGGLRWSSGNKNGTSGLPTFPSCSLTDPIASRDGERSNLRVTKGSACSSTCGRKFELNQPVFIGVLVPNRRWQGLQHFPSLNQTLSRKDSEEIDKGIKLV